MLTRLQYLRLADYDMRASGLRKRIRDSAYLQALGNVEEPEDDYIKLERCMAMHRF